MLIQRLTEAWVAAAEDWRGDLNGVQTVLAITGRPGPGLLSATVTYVVDDRRWTQSFTARGLSDERLARELVSAGLRIERALTSDGVWISAVPVRGDIASDV